MIQKTKFLKFFGFLELPMAAESSIGTEAESEPFLSSLDVVLLIAIAVVSIWWYIKNYVKKEESSSSKSYTIV